MQDRQLYEQILGIRSPWYVERVELQLDKEQGAVRVHLNHEQDRLWACPECGQDCVLYDHQPEREWGGIWTPVSIKRSCTRRRHERTVPSTE